MSVSTQLDLDLDPALAAIRSLETSLNEVAARFGQSLSGAIGDATTKPVVVTAETGEVTSGIEGAVDAADSVKEVAAEAGEVTTGISGAVDAADGVKEVTGEAGEVTSAIEGAVDAADKSVPLDVDATGLAPVQESLGGIKDQGDRATASVAALGPAGVAAGHTAGGGIAGLASELGVARIGTIALAATTLAAGFSYNTLEQRSRAAFTTILGSAEAANQMMDQLRAFARESPFPRQAFIQATQQLLAFGFAAEDIIPTLAAIQDAVAAFGGGAAEIAQITDVFSQIQTQGKITATEINRLSIVGVNALEILAGQAGITASEMRDRISEGAVDAETAITGLTEGMNARFEGAAANVKNTMTGAIDRIKGALRDLGGAILEPFISPTGGGAAVDALNAMATLVRSALIPAFQTFGSIASIALKPLALIGPIVDLIAGLPSPLLAAVTALVALRVAGGPVVQALRSIVEAAGFVREQIRLIAQTRGVSQLSAALGVLRVSFAGVAQAALPLLALTLLMAAAQDLFGSKVDNAAESMRTAADVTGEQADLYRDMATGAIDASQGLDQLIDSGQRLTEQVLEDLIGSADDVRRGLAEVGISTKTLTLLLDGDAKAWRNLTDEQRRALEAVQFANDAIDKTLKVRKEEVQVLLDQAVAEGTLNDAQAQTILARNTNREGILATGAALNDLAVAEAAHQRQVEASDLALATNARSYEALQSAIEDVKSTFPTLGQALSDALGALGGEDDLIFRAMFGNQGEFGAAVNTELGQTLAQTQEFFDRVFAFGDTPALQVALLQLGPQDTGARIFAQLAANEPLVRAGAEQMFQGLIAGRILADIELSRLNNLIAVKTAIMLSDHKSQIELALGGKPITQATEADILAIAPKINELAPEAAEAVNAMASDAASAWVAKEQFGLLPPLTATAGADAAGVPGAIESWTTRTGQAGETQGQSAASGFDRGHQPDPTPGLQNAADHIASFGGAAAVALTIGRVAGENFVTGIIVGLANRIGFARAAAAGVVSEMKAAADTEARASSPSLLFAELGQNISAGLAKGINDDSLRVVRAAESIVAQAARVIVPTANTASAGTSIGTIRVEVNGVADPALARAAARAAGQGIAEGLSTRRTVVGVRTG